MVSILAVASSARFILLLALLWPSLIKAIIDQARDE